jgi:CheY-like chemotaxis protein
LKILIVDDSEDNQRLARLYLRKAGHETEIAENGKIAVEKFVSGDYDLVLMDIRMPVMDGYEAMRTVREWERKKGRSSVPIIVVTAHGDRLTSLAAGCSGYLMRPFSRKQLLDAIDECLAVRSR